MNSSTLILKHSPFVFLKRLAIVELLFAFSPILLVTVLPIEDSYNRTMFARTLTFNIIWTLIVTTGQIFIIAVVFLWWYLPSYVVTKQEIFWRRDGFPGTKPLANTYAITNIDIYQSYLGKRFNYGTLIVHTSDQNELGEIQDIDGPQQIARQIEEMVDLDFAPQALPSAQPVRQLIAGGENQGVEYKASLQWDYRQQKRNKELYEPVMKNLAAFMNTVGGIVLIGVGDDGVVLGLQPDYKTMGKQNSDGFENVFNMAFNKMIGPEYRQYVNVTFHNIEEQEICMLFALPSKEPVFLTYKGEEKFYIRTGNTSQPLSVSKAARFIQTRYQD